MERREELEEALRTIIVIPGVSNARIVTGATGELDIHYEYRSAHVNGLVKAILDAWKVNDGKEHINDDKGKIIIDADGNIIK